jgi:recombinational DNA repair ATPase RecF
MSEKVVETEYDDLAQELGGTIVVIRDQDNPTREMPALIVPAAAVARLAAELEEYHDNANALIAEHSAKLEAGLKTKDWLTEEGQKMQAERDALAEQLKNECTAHAKTLSLANDRAVALAERVEELEGILVRPEPPGAWVSEDKYLQLKSELRDMEASRDAMLGASFVPPHDKVLKIQATNAKLREALEEMPCECEPALLGIPEKTCTRCAALEVE